MDEVVDACPLGLLSVVGGLALLVVALPQCVDAMAPPLSSSSSPHYTLSTGERCLRLIEAALALASLGVVVAHIAYAAAGASDDAGWCEHLHLAGRLGACLLLTAPALATFLWQKGRRSSSNGMSLGTESLYGLCIVLAAAAARLCGTTLKSPAPPHDSQWWTRPGAVLEVALVSLLASLALVKVGAWWCYGSSDSSSSSGRRRSRRRASTRRRRRTTRATLTSSATELEEALLAGAGSEDEAVDFEEGDEEYEEEGSDPAPLDRAGLWSRLGFAWVNGLLRAGSQRQLAFADVPALPRADATAPWARRLQEALAAERGRATPSLLRAAHAAFGAEYYYFAGLQLINDLLAFSGPVLLKLVVAFVEDYAAGAAPLARGYFLLALLVACYVTAALLSTQYNLRMARLQLHLRTALVSAIYAQVLQCRGAQLGAVGSGEVTNMMTVDVQRVQDAAGSFNQFWSLPLQVALTLYLLYREVSYAFVAGLAVILLMVPVNTVIANAITRVTQRQMQYKDRRVQTCDEMLHGIRALKLLAWERLLAARLGELRSQEVRFLSQRKYLDALCVYFWAAMPVLTPLATFIAVVLIDHAISPAAVFTTIALLGMLVFPANAFPWVLNGLMEARVSKRRLQRFLLELPQQPPYVTDLSHARTPASVEDIFCSGREPCLEISGSFGWEPPPSPPPTAEESPDVDGGADGKRNAGAVHGSLRNLPERVVGAAELEDGAGLIDGWEEDSQGGEAQQHHHQQQQQQHDRDGRGFQLRGLDLAVGRGEVVGVYGRIGSGKSTLLLAALGEIYALPPPSPGRVVHRARSRAYVAQSPWLQRGSLRDNIVFGREWDAARFDAVVAACALDADFAALPAGAATEVGERGGTLSGGQRLRVALARALYGRAELYLLDDPFSGLDGRTAAHVAREAVFGMMRREGASVLLVTHALPLLRGCDWAVAMRGGRVVERIRFQEAAETAAAPRAPSTPVEKEAAPAPARGTVAVVEEPPGSQAARKEKEKEDPALASAVPASSSGAVATEEAREEGKVRWGVYRYYAVSAGRLLSALTLVALLGMQLSANAFTYWLGLWSAHTEDYSPRRFLAISGTIAGANTLFTVARSFLFAEGGLRAARALHDRLLAAVLGAAMAFFESHPVGRILNRFAGDTYTIDDSLPFILNIFLAQAAALVGTTVILLIAAPWSALVLVVLVPVYHRLQLYYRASSRELKRLDSVARSPVFAHFGETMAGAVTVRAFGASGRFLGRSLALVDGSQRVAFYSSAASQWLALRLQGFGVAIVASVAAWAVVSCALGRPAPAGLIGLALSYTLPIVGNLSGLLSSYTETEKEMVAVERVHEFTAEPPEPAVLEAEVPVPPTWPAAGAIEVASLTLRYRAGWAPALDRVSLRIRPGEKVAVCGRTGSGKSSLLACLFRLVRWEGRVAIDGLPIHRVPLARLRGSLACIPQEPTLFAGSVRDNLDPADEFGDAEICAALQACRLDAVLREHHRRHGGGKDTATGPSMAQCLALEVKERGSNFSVGQRQLICLCRVLLKRARVVCVDEATASLDLATDAVVRRTIAEAFGDATVITIAHRMSTVLELCSRVLVLSEGRLVEEGDPRALLADPLSHLYALSREEEAAASSTRHKGDRGGTINNKKEE